MDGPSQKSMRYKLLYSSLTLQAEHIKSKMLRYEEGVDCCLVCQQGN